MGGHRSSKSTFGALSGYFTILAKILLRFVGLLYSIPPALITKIPPAFKFLGKSSLHFSKQCLLLFWIPAVAEVLDNIQTVKTMNIT